jgi:hypothetical protein
METTTTNTHYMQWLHDLTVAGYEQGIMIEAVHKDVLDLYYHEGRSASDALEQYKDFLSRWNAIRKDEGRPYYAGNLNLNRQDVVVYNKICGQTCYRKQFGRTHNF